MAKRKRLTPLAGLGEPQEDGMNYPMGVARTFTRPPPVAQVAGASAAQAALEELSAEMQAARRGGRMVVDLPLDAIEAGYLMRDRMVHDSEEMAALKSSLAARGQQAPIEVVELGPGRYGLIAGARRLAALKALAEETGEARFSQVQALIRPHASAPEAYLAMVEENEIRADLSFYERGRLAAEAARAGIYDSASAAVKHLFANATPSRRSKILSFVAVHEALGSALRFPEAIPERLGLSLAAALGTDRGFAGRLTGALSRAKCATAAAERTVLERALRPGKAPEKAGTEPVSAPSSPARRTEPDGAGIRVSGGAGRVVLEGPGVSAALLADLRTWLAARR